MLQRHVNTTIFGIYTTFSKVCWAALPWPILPVAYLSSFLLRSTNRGRGTDCLEKAMGMLVLLLINCHSKLLTPIRPKSFTPITNYHNQQQV